MTNPARKLVYIAHPLGAGPDRDENIANAERWVAWAGGFEDVAPVAPWITLAKHWSETMREQGLAIDFAVIERCDEVWLVGGRIFPGMALEADYGRKLAREIGPCAIVDLTGLGYCPRCTPSEAAEMVNEARKAARTPYFPRGEHTASDLVGAVHRLEDAKPPTFEPPRAFVPPNAMLAEMMKISPEHVRSGLAAPPKPGEDVALPILTDDEGRPLANPYIPAGRGAEPTYAEIPEHLTVLYVEHRGITSYYVHTDPRMVAAKREALISTGAVPSNACTAYLYDRLPEGTEGPPGHALLLALYPGRVDAFYFTFAAWGTAGSAFDTFNAKRDQLKDPNFDRAAWHSPNARGVAYSRGEKLP